MDADVTVVVVLLSFSFWIVLVWVGEGGLKENL
jgi:hypothetical protein